MCVWGRGRGEGGHGKCSLDQWKSRCLVGQALEGTLDGRTRNALKRKARDLCKKRDTIADGLALTNYHKLLCTAGELTVAAIEDPELLSEADMASNLALLVKDKIHIPLQHRLALVRRSGRMQFDRGCVEAVVDLANPFGAKGEFDPFKPKLCDAGATAKQQVATFEFCWPSKRSSFSFRRVS